MFIVPAIATPVTAEHARDALLAAKPGLDRESAALLLSLVWVETGSGTGMRNWNAGNITASDAWTGPAWRPPWFLDSENPHLHELHERMLKGEAPSAFRGYGSSAEGFADFVRVLEHSFASVLHAAASGDPAEFVRALHESGYSKDYSPAHIATFASLRHSFAPLVAHLPAGSVAGSFGLALVAGVALFALNSRRRRRRKESHGRQRAHRQ